MEAARVGETRDRQEGWFIEELSLGMGEQGKKGPLVGCWVYVGDEIYATQLLVGIMYNKPWNMDPLIKQPVWLMESIRPGFLTVTQVRRITRWPQVWILVP